MKSHIGRRSRESCMDYIVASKGRRFESRRTDRSITLRSKLSLTFLFLYFFSYSLCILNHIRNKSVSIYRKNDVSINSGSMKLHWWAQISLNLKIIWIIQNIDVIMSTFYLNGKIQIFELFVPPKDFVYLSLSCGSLHVMANNLQLFISRNRSERKAFFRFDLMINVQANPIKWVWMRSNSQDTTVNRSILSVHPITQEVWLSKGIIIIIKSIYCRLGVEPW